MIEVRVQCICTAIQLPDLGEKLFRGDVLFLPKDRADRSKDLALAKANRAVLCTEVVRCQESRPAPVSSINPYIPAERQKPPQPVVTMPPQVVREVAGKVASVLNKSAVVIEPSPVAEEKAETSDEETVEGILGPIMDSSLSESSRKRGRRKDGG